MSLINTNSYTCSSTPPDMSQPDTSNQDFGLLYGGPGPSGVLTSHRSQRPNSAPGARTSAPRAPGSTLSGAQNSHRRSITAEMLQATRQCSADW